MVTILLLFALVTLAAAADWTEGCSLVVEVVIVVVLSSLAAGTTPAVEAAAEVAGVANS